MPTLLPAGPMHLPAVDLPISPRLALLAGLLAASVVAVALVAFALLRRPPGSEASAFQRVARNSLFPMATSFVNKFLDLGFAMYTFRALGPEGVGNYTYAVVILGYLDILANFGLGTLLTREVARDRTSAGRYLANTLAARGALWFVALAVVGMLMGPAAGPLAITQEVGLAVLLLTLGLLPSLVSATLTALFMAYEKFEYPAAVTVLTTLLKIALGVAALMAGWGFVGLAAVSVVVNLVTMVALAALASATGIVGSAKCEVRSASAPASALRTSHFALSSSFCWKLLGISYPLMLNNLLNSVFYRVDSLMLQPMAGAAALGWYGTAYKFIDGLGLISSSLTLALFPLLSQYAHSARDSLARTFALAIKLLLMASLPICVGTTLLAPEIILLFAGPDYLPHSAVALQILIWFLPFSFINGVTQYVLIAIDQQRFLTLSFLIATTFNVVTNLLLIPLLGYVGAAATTVASEWVLMIPFWYCLRRHLPPIPVLRLAWRPAAAAAIMGLEVWALRDWSLPLAIVLAPAVYGAGLLALRSFEQEELKMVARMLPWGKA